LSGELIENDHDHHDGINSSGTSKAVIDSQDSSEIGHVQSLIIYLNLSISLLITVPWIQGALRVNRHIQHIFTS